jgi:hypothetical protein
MSERDIAFIGTIPTKEQKKRDSTMLPLDSFYSFETGKTFREFSHVKAEPEV